MPGRVLSGRAGGKLDKSNGILIGGQAVGENDGKVDKRRGCGHHAWIGAPEKRVPPSRPTCLHEDSTLNALTKAFVVVVTILAVILVALVVPFAARVPDYARQYKDLKLELDAQVAKAGVEVQKYRAEQAAFGTKLDDKDKEVIKLRSENASLMSDLKAEQAKVAAADAATAKAVAALEVATRTSEANNAQLAANADVIQKSIATLGELNAQIADLSQTIITVRAENSRLSQNYLRIQEENKALVTKLEELALKYDEIIKVAQGMGIDLEAKLAGTVPSGIEIRGSVTKIDQVSDGLTFVQVNVGTRDQVKEGMEFTVYRGDQFVGTIKIATVDTAEAVGRLTLGTGIQEGDKVRTGGR